VHGSIASSICSAGPTEAVGRYCAGEGDYGTRLAFGDCQIHDPLDLEAHTNLFLIWGATPRSRTST
jgi:hypothetical protein